MQHQALNEIKEMAASYGFDISEPAKNAKEAVQWTYFGYLAAIKENNGAAMSLGRVATFLDIYFERDLKNGTFIDAICFTSTRIFCEPLYVLPSNTEDFLPVFPVYIGVTIDIL